MPEPPWSPLTTGSACSSRGAPAARAGPRRPRPHSDSLVETPSRRERKVLRALARRKGRESHGLFLAEGPNLARELLDSDLEVELAIHTAAFASDRERRRLLRGLRERGADLREVDEGTLSEFADTVTPRGVLAAVRTPTRRLDDLPAGGLLVLDAVQDPGNLGTLVRTAEAMGVAGVVALSGTVDAWNPKAVRAAAGSTFRVAVVDAPWEEARRRLRDLGAEVWAADPLGEPIYGGGRGPDAVALVLGNEGRGVSRGVLEDARRRIRVPTAGSVESLNVAVAGALLLDRIFGLRSAGAGGAA